MTFKILDRKKKYGLTVKNVVLPLATSELLGSGIDVTTLPEGHLCCIKCGKHRFEAWVYLDNHRLEMGCMNCGASYRLLFPLDCDLSVAGKSGRYTCRRHPENAMILIHNVDTISVGCERCRTEINFLTKTKTNLIVPEDMH